MSSGARPPSAWWTGRAIASADAPRSVNHAVWWDADPLREIEDAQLDQQVGLEYQHAHASADRRRRGVEQRHQAERRAHRRPARRLARRSDLARSTDNVSLRIYSTTIPAVNRIVHADARSAVSRRRSRGRTSDTTSRRILRSSSATAWPLRRCRTSDAPRHGSADLPASCRRRATILAPADGRQVSGRCLRKPDRPRRRGADGADHQCHEQRSGPGTRDDWRRSWDRSACCCARSVDEGSSRPPSTPSTVEGDRRVGKQERARLVPVKVLQGRQLTNSGIDRPRVLVRRGGRGRHAHFTSRSCEFGFLRNPDGPPIYSGATQELIDIADAVPTAVPMIDGYPPTQGMSPL